MSKEELKAEPRTEVVSTTPGADEVIHAPKGTSRGRFLLAFLLAIMVLTTFSVSDEVVGCFSGRSRGGQTYLAWEDPVRGHVNMNAADFQLAAQRYAIVMEALTGNRNRNNQTPEDTARFLVLDSVARGAGIYVTDKELGELLLRAFGSSDVYNRVRQNFRISAKDFEETLRRMMIVNRYQGMVAAAAMATDPASVEKLWKSRHQEYAFEYVELPAEKVTEEARALAPSGDELKKWFDALSEPEKAKYKTDDRARAEVAYMRIGPGMKGTEVLAKYPAPQPQAEDDETRAKKYYDGFYYVLFPNPDYRPDPKNFDPSKFYKPFEDVKQQCLEQEPIYTALMAWVADMIGRKDKGEPYSVLEEGQAMRLGFHNQPEMWTRAQWMQQGPGWGRYVSEAIFDPARKPGEIHPAVVVEKDAFVIVRIVEREDARMPEFSEIEARVKEDWIKKKAIDLAVAKLEALRDKLGTRPQEGDPSAALWRPEVDSDTFAKVAKEAGFEVHRRDWEERATMPKAGETPTPAQLFLRQAGALYTMKEGSVAKAEPSRDNSTAFLVRVAGVRDADVAKMTPADLETMTQQARQTASMDFQTRLFQSNEFLKEHYGVWLKSWEEEKKPSAP